MIIGLTGKAGSGKTTVANILVRKHGFVRRPFAYALKSMIASLGFDRAVLDGPAAGKEVPLELFNGRTLREAMQTIGTEWGRAQFGDDFWVNVWRKGQETIPGPVVADDVRFANEAAAIRALGGRVWRLERKGAGASIGAGHASEQLFGIEPDEIVHNDYEWVSDLEREIDELLVGHLA
jgi:hypothetical protein